jgi:glutamate synthase (NADPH/NADH) small chain
MSTITKPNAEKATGLKPEVKIILERCVGCQECVIRCPTQALSMDITNWKAKANNDLCVGCRQCQRTCPFSAISVIGPRMVTDRTHFSPYNHRVVIGENNEVRPGFANLKEAIKEAERCLNCPDPTCVRGCPAHNDIPRFIEAIRNRDLAGAQSIIAQTSCLPDICSRVCNWASQCEGSCSWALAGGEPVAIGTLERCVTDNSPVPPVQVTSDRGKGLRVGIVGSGPSGIAAAYELLSAGASVDIYERGSVAGGVLQWGIPSYILPDKVSDRPVKALIDAGVKIHPKTSVTPEVMEELLKTHDALIAAQGAPIAERPNIPGINLEGVVDATIFLTNAKRSLAEGTLMPELKGVHVLDLGGSDTALDVARSILRLGGKPIVIHRREEQFSRARPDELAEAKNEGVEFRFATNLARLEGENGKLKRAVLVRTRQSKAQASPEVIKGSEEIFEVNLVVLSTGYGLDPKFKSLFAPLPLRQPASDRYFPDRRWVASGLLAGNNPVGKMAWDREYGLRSSTHPRQGKLWLVGDALVGPSSVVSSMAQGRQAARAILENHSPIASKK